MTIKRLSITFIFALLLTSLAAFSEEAPEVGKWYFLTFNNSGNVITAHGDGAVVTCTGLTASNSQMWQLAGTAADGYTITNADGQHLTVTATRSSRVSATKAGTATLFTVDQVSGGYEIRPKANSAIAFNQFGGATDGAQVGLWTAGSDQNNVILFKEAHSQADYQALPRLIPWPRQITVGEGKTFDVTSATTVVYDMASAHDFIDDFVTTLNAKAGTHLTATQGKATGARGEISFTTVAQADSNAYHLTVDSTGIRIEAGDRLGFFYALQTLKQLLPDTYYGGKDKTHQGWTVAQVDIHDKPLLGYRGYMLDVSRHFFSKQEVMRVLDMMAFYKLNRFHWHLTDDQGWRIEIPEYPLLTKVGSRRAGSLVNSAVGNNKAFYDDTPYGEGMYYTLQDLRDIVAYASARGIEIIPEVDMPGHMVAALAAYPWLSCDSTKDYAVRIASGISTDVLNVGDDRVIDFLKCVLKHVAEVFPGRYIHIGGDECPTDNWKTNPQCLQRVSQEGLTGVDQLQSWLVEELGEYLKKNFNKDVVVWDELLNNWKSTNEVRPVVMAWNGAAKTVDAANQGLKSIYAVSRPLYFSMMQVPESQCDVNEVYQGGFNATVYNTLPAVYAVNPLQNIESAGKADSCVLGVQANMWTETCSDSTQLEYQLLPRLAALAEVAWLPDSLKDYVSFYNRLQHHDEIYDALGYTYAHHYIEADTLSTMTTALNEAREIIAATHAGEAGYASVEATEALKQAVATAEALDDNDADGAKALQAAIDTFKAAPVTQPDTAAVYQILSASTYYHERFAGAGLYQTTTDELHVHYTRQDEPEELWQFAQRGDSLFLTSVRTGRQVTLGAIGSNAGMSDKGTALRMDKATVANKTYTYIPGVVTLSAVDGYAARNTGNVKRLVATSDGNDNVVKVQDQPQLCMPGTWTLSRVDDYTALLRSLVKKCERLILDNDTMKVDNYTPEAIAYLATSLVAPARQETQVSRDRYDAYMDIYSRFLAMPKTDNGPWATSFERNAARTNTARQLNSVSLGAQTITNPARMTMYQDMTDQVFIAKAGQNLTPTFNFNGRWMNGYVYVDRQSDGTFSAQVNADGTPAEGTDLMTYSYCGGHNSNGQTITGQGMNVLNPPAFTLPQLEDGFYRMRYKVDWDCLDAAGSTKSGNDIITNGGDIMDMRLRVYTNDEVTVSTQADGGLLLTTTGSTLNGTKTAIGQPLKFKVEADDDNQLYSLEVSHGILTGDSLKNGVAQRVTSSLSVSPASDGTYTIPAALVDGDLQVKAVFAKLIFDDEFNQPGNTRVDSTKWSTSARAKSAWNRFIVDSDDLAFVQDTVLVLRCKPNPDKTGDDDAMISGAKETRGKFAFTYGMMEVRMKTTNHTGNFPAAWMMPQPPCAGWPAAGEIDVFESINAQNRAFHTIHSTWADTYGQKDNPANSGSENIDVTQWHVYALQWTPTQLTWLVDGQVRFTYTKSTDKSTVDAGQWPFDHPFYIILNQSVGNGSWAANPDTTFTYESQVDYVRVWQTADQTALGIHDVNADRDTKADDDRIYDLQGRRVNRPATHGIYIRGGKKVIF